MKMYAFKMNHPAKDLTCEHCGDRDGTWGVVTERDLQDIQRNVEMKKKDCGLFLIEEIGIGEIMCSECIEQRSGKPIPIKTAQ